MFDICSVPWFCCNYFCQTESYSKSNCEIFRCYPTFTWELKITKSEHIKKLRMLKLPKRLTWNFWQFLCCAVLLYFFWMYMNFFLLCGFWCTYFLSKRIVFKIKLSNSSIASKLLESFTFENWIKWNIFFILYSIWILVERSAVVKLKLSGKIFWFGNFLKNINKKKQERIWV